MLFHWKESLDGWNPIRIDAQRKQKKLLRMGMSTALAITIHNFPEGLAGMVAGPSPGGKSTKIFVCFFQLGGEEKESSKPIFHLELCVFPLGGGFLEATSSSKEKFVLFLPFFQCNPKNSQLKQDVSYVRHLKPLRLVKPPKTA